MDSQETSLQRLSAKCFQEGYLLKTLTIDVSLDRLAIGNLIITRGEQVDIYEQVLGPPNRCLVPRLRAPAGHRNNVVYFFDECGVVLNEHHATHLIQGVDVILDPESARYGTLSAFNGSLEVLGVPIHAGVPFIEFARQWEFSFQAHLGHAWFLDGEHISIQFEMLKTSRRSRLENATISYLAIGFLGAHKSD